MAELAPAPPGDAPGADVRPHYGCIGCLTGVAGFFGGGMFAVLVAKVVGNIRRCVPPVGLPACDWHVYVGVGGLVGALLLVLVTFWRLRRGAAVNSTQRG